MIVSNKKDAFVHHRAKALGIPSYTYSKKEFDEGGTIAGFLCRNKIDFIVLAGFLLRVSLPIIEAFPHKIINIHPALLPGFGGKGMYGDHVHRAVKEAGENKSGITVHYVNENYDEGSIIFQASCSLTSDDSPEAIAEKVHALEYRYFSSVIETTIKKTYPSIFL